MCLDSGAKWEIVNVYTRMLSILILIEVYAYGIVSINFPFEAALACSSDYLYLGYS